MIAKKKTSKGNFALYILLFIALVAISGVLNFVVASFSLAVIATASYWVKTITSALIGLGAFMLSSFMKRDLQIAKDTDFNEGIEELNKTISTSIDDDFSDYVATVNREEKIAAWKTKQENKLTKWNNKIKAKVLVDIKIIDDEKWTWNIPSWRLFKRMRIWKRLRRANKWSRKRANIKTKLTSKWIEENIDYVKLPYSDITRSEILTGERNNINGIIIDNSAMRHIAKDRLPVVLITTLLMAAYHSLNFLQAVNTVGLILGVIVQLITIGMNTMLGFNYGLTLFKKIDLNNLFTRREYIVGYLK